MLTDNKFTVMIAALCLLFFSYKAPAGFITYEFSGQKNSYIDVYPRLPNDLYETDIWDVTGNITLDTDSQATEDEQIIYLGSSIVDATLSINGYSVGEFNTASFMVIYLDSIKENEYPYSLDFVLYFDNNINFGEIYLGYYTEDIGWSGPDFEGINAKNAIEVMGILDYDQYQELWLGGRNENDTAEGGIQLKMISGMSLVYEVPISGTFSLLGIGLIFLARLRK